ncbi:MAG: threonine synthase [Anaerolineales bacterium]
MNEKFLGYQCSLCGKKYGPEEVTYTCPEDGGNLNVVLDHEHIRASSSPDDIEAGLEHSVWRYLPLLPVEDPGHLGSSLRSVGWTPLYAPENLREAISMPKLWVKDDGRNPTASFKDRASAIVVSRAQEIQADRVVTASTGNAGAALAGMAAAAGVPAVILAPKTAPPAKVAQLLIFGADVYLVDGSYDHAFDLSVKASEKYGWYCRNTGYNPFTAEGKKTAAFEICEQLTLAEPGDTARGEAWRVPDAVFVSVGDGNIISGLHKGFKDLLALGWIEKMPRIFGIQARGSAAIYNAFAAGVERIEAVEADTLADSISVDLPRDGIRALRAATETGGAYLVVSDRSILAAMKHLAVLAGVFAEPAGAAAHAGLRKAVEAEMISPEDTVVLLNTGNGIKDVASAMEATGEARVIEPTIEALAEAVEGQA